MRNFELRLIEVLKVQSYSEDFYHMSKFICKKITQMGLEYTKDKLGNIYVVKGDAEFYPTMVSHIDTVHIYNPNYQVHQAGRNIFAINKKNCQRLGVGGDDKVGVFLTLEFLRNMDNFKAVFFVDEEIGCVGSSQCDFTFFIDSAFVLECDRKGALDFVNNISGKKLYSSDFANEIKPILRLYNREEEYGGMTDVQQIAAKTDLCVANMSCGYYEPHTDDEYVNIDDVVDTYNLCLDMYESLSHKQWNMPREDRQDNSYSSYYGGYTRYGAGSSQSSRYINPEVDGFDDIEDPLDVEYINDSDIIECAFCGCNEAVYDSHDDTVYCYGCEMYITGDEYLAQVENNL